MFVASVLILLVLWHVRSAIVVCLTLPLAVLVSFILMRLLGIPSNIMSLSGLAISIGVLVDSSIVMVENATHELYGHFGRSRVTGDTRELVLPAMRTVGRPIFFSVMIMVISFIPVFALGGMEGRMFHPLAWTKTFALLGVSILAITFVPALVPLMIRGRLHSEEDSWLVRSVTEIYRPVMRYLLDHPWPIVLLTGVIFILGSIPIGVPIVFHDRAGRGDGRPRSGPTYADIRGSTAATIGADRSRRSCSSRWWRTRRMTPLGSEFMPPLDEGTILDMPVTIPRASITEVADDLKARDALLRSFPEVELVVGKAGRAETPTDPAPPDMVETVVNLRPRDHWPKRELRFDAARRQTEDILAALVARGWIKPPPADDETPGQRRHHVRARKVRPGDPRHGLPDYAQFQHELAPVLLRFAVDETLTLMASQGKLEPRPQPGEITAIVASLPKETGVHLVESPDVPTVTKLAQQVAAELTKRGLAKPGPDLLLLDPGPIRRVVQEAGEVLGRERAHVLLDAARRRRAPAKRPLDRARQKVQLDAVRPHAALLHPASHRRALAQAKKLKLTNSTPSDADLSQFNAELTAPFADRAHPLAEIEGRPAQGNGQRRPSPRLGQHLDPADHQPRRHAGHRRPHDDRRQGLRRQPRQDSTGRATSRRRAQDRCPAPPTSSPTRSSAKATSRSTSTATRPPATASTSATSRTSSRRRSAAR